MNLPLSTFSVDLDSPEVFTLTDATSKAGALVAVWPKIAPDNRTPRLAIADARIMFGSLKSR
jgi:hypothetical protein